MVDNLLTVILFIFLPLVVIVWVLGFQLMPVLGS